MRQMIGASTPTTVTVSSTTAAAMAGLAVAGIVYALKAPVWGVVLAGAGVALLTKTGIDSAAATT